MIESYRFGRITILGHTYREDVTIIGRKVLPGWRRQSGHLVTEGDLVDVLGYRPDILVIGRGSLGMMRVHESLSGLCSELGIELVTRRTGPAVTAFNAFLAGEATVAGAFHLTC